MAGTIRRRRLPHSRIRNDHRDRGGIGRFHTADRRGGGVDAGLALIQGREYGALVANIADRERHDSRVEIVQRAHSLELRGVPHQKVRLVPTGHQGRCRVTA